MYCTTLLSRYQYHPRAATETPCGGGGGGGGGEATGGGGPHQKHALSPRKSAPLPGSPAPRLSGSPAPRLLGTFAPTPPRLHAVPRRRLVVAIKGDDAQHEDAEDDGDLREGRRQVAQDDDLP